MRAIGMGRRGPIWPVMGGNGEGGGEGGAAAGGTDDGPETGTKTDDGQTKPPETMEFWRDQAREQEKRAKSNAAAAKKLAELEESQKTQAQKDADRVKAAEDEVANVPAKVAEALKTHLVALHKIDAEEAELFLTATDPDQLQKQVAALIAKSGKRKNSNYVPNEGKTTTTPEADAGMREFTRNLFGNGNQ
ncbi:MAG: hypothetical protein HYZ39_16370 [Mycolicibacterium cosmeticum]|nr:hypothetical protein [Mycolicibacterium cosmeticum]